MSFTIQPQPNATLAHDIFLESVICWYFMVGYSAIRSGSRVFGFREGHRIFNLLSTKGTQIRIWGFSHLYACLFAHPTSRIFVAA